MDAKKQEKLKNKAQKRLDNARITLKNLNNRKEERIKISKKAMIGYCTQTIVFCESVLAMIK